MKLYLSEPPSGFVNENKEDVDWPNIISLCLNTIIFACFLVLYSYISRVGMLFKNGAKYFIINFSFALAEIIATLIYCFSKNDGKNKIFSFMMILLNCSLIVGAFAVQIIDAFVIIR